jgi:hypothetical protein
MTRSTRILAALALATPLVLSPSSGSEVGAIPPTPVLAYVKPVAGVPTVFTSALDGTGAHARISHARSVAVSPDGKHMTYFSTAGHVSVATITGGSRTALVDASSISGMSWAPDNTRVVVATPTGLKVVNTVSHVVRSLATTKGCVNPQWAPDGTLIAAQCGSKQLLVTPGGTARTYRTGFATGPWSPDGRWMLITGPTSPDILARDVRTNDDAAVLGLLGSFNNVGSAWGPIVGTSVSYYMSFDGTDRPSPGPITLVRTTIDTSVPGDPGEGTGIAINATSPSVGGLTITDANGAPPPVTNLHFTVRPSYIDLWWTAPANTPDFAGVTVRYATSVTGTATPPATITDGEGGARVLGNHVTIGPLERDLSVAFSVFSRDWSGHIGTVATAITSTSFLEKAVLTASASPSRITAGGSSAITLRLRSVTGRRLPGEAIKVSARPLGSTGAFTWIGTVRTSSTGVATIRQSPARSRQYRFVSDAVFYTPASATVSIVVKPRT